MEGMEVSFERRTKKPKKEEAQVGDSKKSTKEEKRDIKPKSQSGELPSHLGRRKSQ